MRNGTRGRHLETTPSRSTFHRRVTEAALEPCSRVERHESRLPIAVDRLAQVDVPRAVETRLGSWNAEDADYRLPRAVHRVNRFRHLAAGRARRGAHT